jgi:hypothetical protein
MHEFLHVQEAHVLQKVLEPVLRAGGQIPGRGALSLVLQLGVALGIQIPVVIEMEPPVATDRVSERPQAEEPDQKVVEQLLPGSLPVRAFVRHQGQPVLTDSCHDHRKRKRRPVIAAVRHQCHGDDDQQPVARHPDGPLEQARLHQAAQRLLLNKG